MRDREKSYLRVLALTTLILLLTFSSSAASASSATPPNLIPSNLTSSNLTSSNLAITQLTTSGSATFPSIDGDRIVYNDYRNGKSHICMYNLSTSEETVIISSKISVFTSDIYGDRIVWCEEFKEDIGVVEELVNFLKSSVRKTIEFIIRFPVGPHNPDDIKCNIYVYNLSTQEKTQIATRESYNAVPKIYGDNIVWEGSSDINGTFDLCLYNLSTHTKTQITTSGSAISPIIYGDRIIYDDFSSGKHEVYMYDLSLSREVPLPRNDSWQGAYAIYEDKLVIFHSDDQRTTDIYLHDLSTQQETRITTNRFATSPAIYGNRIVWMGNPYDTVNYNIYIYDFSTKKETQITTSGTAFDPIIYGDTIVWQDRKPKGEHSETLDIYICNLNSSLSPVIESSESGMSGEMGIVEFLGYPRKISYSKLGIRI